MPRPTVDDVIRVLGGPTKASHACLMSVAAIYDWAQRGFIRNGPAAYRLAQAARAKGLEVTVDDLVQPPVDTDADVA